MMIVPRSEATRNSFLHIYRLCICLLSFARCFPLADLEVVPNNPLNFCHFDASDKSATFQQITIDPSTGVVYAAGRNTLYKLSPVLRALDFSSTGPVVGCSRSSERDCLVDKYSSLLEIISTENKQLLLCGGSARKDSCSVFMMEHLKLAKSLDDRVVDTKQSLDYRVANTKQSLDHWLVPDAVAMSCSDVVSLFSPETSPKDNSIVYKACSNYDRLSAPSISSSCCLEKSLNSSNTYEMRERSRIDLNSQSRTPPPTPLPHLVRYVYAFESDGFIYFVSVQRDSLSVNDNYDTRLVRLCRNDTAFHSYSELTLSCRKMTSLATFYNVALAGYLGRAGNDTAKRFGLSVGDEILYLTMGRSEVNSSVAESRYGSGLCMFLMRDVRAAFTRAQKDCYLGNGRILPWIHGPGENCIVDVSI